MKGGFLMPVQMHSMGWLPDYPDFRDYTTEHAAISPLLKKIGLTGSHTKSLPESADLRAWCSTIEDQGSLGSCTAQAGASMVEYFAHRSMDRYTDVSRLFLYKVTRNLMRQKGDTGAFIRTTMGALVLFGVPPELYWPYKEKDFDKEPPAFCYAFAQNYQAISYYRLDAAGLKKNEVLQAIKSNLAAGLPSMFGFSVFSSISQAGENGQIPYPMPGEKILGGHAVMAVGYDDKIEIANTNPDGPTRKGAFLIRNSWGPAWGLEGYGWLPYEYLLKGLAIDWWSIIKNEWIETGDFEP
ncbi:MAG TPA: C1 family peptidase [bacterium]|nr:C1 family peptidase [bacterium]HPM58493.1 C1 family peptidase [bacterium]